MTGGTDPVPMPVQVVCPRCGQGWVTEQVVEQTGDRWWVCDECDAVWHVLEPVRVPGFEDLSSMLRLRGVPLASATLRPPRPGDPDPRRDLDAAFRRSDDPDPQVRAHAAVTLAPATATAAVGDRLVAMLDDTDPQVAAAAAAGLARYGDDAAFGAVRASVRDADDQRRAHLVEAVVATARDHFFTAHRLVGWLEAASDPPADLDRALRSVLAPPA